MLFKATHLVRKAFFHGALLSILVCFLVSPVSLSARDVETSGIFSRWQSSTVDYSSTPHRAKIACTSLSEWSVYPAQVLIARQGKREKGLPEYCDVLGHIQSNIKFRLFLPARWNGRFFMVGNGGLAGHQQPSSSTYTTLESSSPPSFTEPNTSSSILTVEISNHVNTSSEESHQIHYPATETSSSNITSQATQATVIKSSLQASNIKLTTHQNQQQNHTQQTQQIFNTTSNKQHVVRPTLIHQSQQRFATPSSNE